MSEATAPGGPRSPREWLRAVGNAVNLSTPLGLILGLAGGARFRRGPNGLVLGEGYRFAFPMAGAFTVGNVLITATSWEAILRVYPGLLRHEERHSWQYLYCLGVPFFPLYTACMGWSLLRTGDRAAGNFFERQAGLELGGYRRYPTRPIREGIRDLAGRVHRLGGRRSESASGPSH